MQMDNLRELFLEELADLYHAEKQLVKALPDLVKHASSEQLKEAFESHLEETEEHVCRCEEVFELFGRDARSQKCQGMEGLLDEIKKLLREEKGPVLDAALIAAAQKTEHYEIAAYGTLCTWAKLLGELEVLDLLKENIASEKSADEILTQIAESSVNVEAAEKPDSHHGKY